MEDQIPQPELRITHACAASGFPFFLPKYKSVSREGPIYRCVTECRTVGPDILQLHGEEKKILAESIFAPYRKNGELTQRVVSLIRPI